MHSGRQTLDPDTMQRLIAVGDPMLALPHRVLAAVVQGLGATDVEHLLAFPDRRIHAAVEAHKRSDARSVNELRRWLADQRLQRAPRAATPIEAKLAADAMLAVTTHDLATALRDAIKAQALAPEEVVRRCGASREAVLALLAGATPPTWESALRIAAVLGLRVSIQVEHPEAAGEPSASSAAPE